MIFSTKPRESASTSWLWAGAWVVFIYLTIPLARSIQEVLRDRGGKAVFLWVVFLSLAAAIGWMIRAVIRKQWKGRPVQILVLAVIGTIYSWLTWSLRTNPEEAFHFVQYGVLSLLLFRAFSHRLQDPSIYVATFLLGAAFGICDEVIQWVTPRRVFDYRDIAINAAAVGLMQIALAAGIRPALIRGRPTRAGIQICFRATVLNGLLLLFCLSSTPSVVDVYSRWIPAAATLNQATAEYGFWIEDPEIGAAFFSRLPPGELKRQDREQGAAAAARINRTRSDRQYGRFLEKTPAHHDPVAVEARIHLFRRDRHAGQALARSKPKEAAYFAQVAHGENRILEKWFSNTLHQSIFRWPQERIQRMHELSMGPAAYTSAVSSQLITRFNRRQAVTFLGLLSLLAVIGERWTARRRKA